MEYKEECETEIASTSQVLQKSEPLILWIQIQRVLEKPPLLPLIFLCLYIPLNTL